MTEPHPNSTLIMEQFGQELRQDLAHWAAQRDQVGRVGARLVREGFQRPATAKPSFSWVWFPAGLASALAVVAVLFAFPRPLKFTVDGAPSAVGSISGSQAKAQRLAFSDGSEIVTGPGTRCAVSEVTPHGARVDLMQGSVEAAIQHRAGTTWSVNAGPFRVAVTGTRFSVTWDEASGKLAVDLHEGSVLVTGSCISERRLQKGQSLNVSCPKPIASAEVAPVVSAGEASVASLPTRALPELAPTGGVQRLPATAPKKPAIGSEDALANELNALAEVRRELSKDPARALALADESRAKFPNGALREEREALSVFALDKLGRTDEVGRRAKRFLAKFPDGPFSAKVRGILEHVAAAPPSR